MGSGFPIYVTHRPPSKVHQFKLGFCLLSLLRRRCSLLYLERLRASANERAVLRNPSSLQSYTERGRIRFLGSAKRDCSRSSPRLLLRPNQVRPCIIVCNTVCCTPSASLSSSSTIRLPDDTCLVRAQLFNSIFNHIL